MKYVVVGGGVAGVCCAEELCRLCPDDEIVLVSADRSLKGVNVVARLTQSIEELEVVEKRLDEGKWPNLTFVLGRATALSKEESKLELTDGRRVYYDKLCIATGARPLRLPGVAPAAEPYVLTLRDTDSVAALAGRLRRARHVTIVGNGGIALELVHALRGVDITWIVKHLHIADAFFDVDAAEFLSLEGQTAETETPTSSGDPETPAPAAPGHAVGPTWSRALQPKSTPGAHAALRIELGCEVAEASLGGTSDGGPTVRLELTDGRRVECDVVVAALGVVPNAEWVAGQLQRADDGGIAVDVHLRSVSDPNRVWAAGDVCSATQLASRSPGECQWFQMRLWTQARSEGILAAHSMAGVEEDTGASMAFELFTHVTSFAGMKVVLLGRYNGQGLEHEPAESMVSYSRTTPPDSEGCNGTFVRLLLRRDRVEGAVLIGETGLEETVEHLILDRLVVGHLMPGLLDPLFELDHVFD